MRIASVWLAAGITLWGASIPALAQQPTPACQAAALPAEMTGWCARKTMSAAANAAGLADAVLEIGQGYDAGLKSTADVRYVTRPEKPGGSVSFGGLFSFSVAHSGTYRVALGSGAWIDLLKDGQAITSTSHGHGPDGSGIRKMVDFPLSPGRYTLQLAANGEPGSTLMIVRLP